MHLRKTRKMPDLQHKFHSTCKNTFKEYPLVTTVVRDESLVESDNTSMRYEQDFEKIEKIDRGTHASIYKSRNRLDDQIYAVKKITLEVKGDAKEMEEEIERVLQETKALAKANHPNIIRYYNSWLEISKNQEESGSQSTSENLKPSLIKSKVHKDIPVVLKFEKDSGEFEYENQDEDDEENNNAVFSLDLEDQSNAEQKKRGDNDTFKVVFEGKGDPKNAKKLEFTNFHVQTTQISETRPRGMSILESMKLKKTNSSNERINPTSKKAATSLLKEIDSPILKKKTIIKPQNKSIEEKNNKRRKFNNELPKRELENIQRNLFKGSTGRSDQNSLEFLKSITLYIQTELCRYSIEDYISKRNTMLEMKIKNSVDYSAEKARYLIEAQRFALELIKGLKYIHDDCKMAHRDLKPNNIYLTDDNIIKIGGFGLVKDVKFFNTLRPSPMLSAISTPERTGSPDQERSFLLSALNGEANCEFELKIDDDEALSNEDFLSGSNSKFDDFDGSPFESLSPQNKLKVDSTNRFEIKSPKPSPTKASGEIFSQSNNGPVADTETLDQRGDIWSLGIIVLLLFYPMSSMLEQNMVLNQCENGDLPERFLIEQPTVARIVQRMISRDPYERPLLKEIDQVLGVPNNFLGKVLVRREGTDPWREKWVRVTDESIYIFKDQSNKKADTVLRLEQWSVSLQREGDKQNSCINLLQKQVFEKEENKNKSQGTLTYINLENKALIGYHFTSDHIPTTEMIYYQMTNRT